MKEGKGRSKRREEALRNLKQLHQELADGWIEFNPELEQQLLQELEDLKDTSHISKV